MPSPIAAKSCRDLAQGVLDDRVSLLFPQLGAQCFEHRDEDLALDTGLVEQRQLRINHILVEHAHVRFLRKGPTRAA